ncbi:MAG: hypothetical protein GXW85_11385 [Clostridia bacterium]|nr:hypothetical protein [Clostridia bacterium]
MDKELRLITQKLDWLITNPEVLAAFVVGSAAVSQNLSSTGDIDVFIILAGGQNLEREVIERDGMVWDITYFPLEIFKEGIREKWPFLLLSLEKNIPLVVRDEQINLLMKDVYEAINKGPGALTGEEVKFLRFKLTQDYEALVKRMNDNLNAIFLAHNLFREVLNAYFKLNNLWVPREKKMLTWIKKGNPDLYTLCVNFLEENRLQKKLSILENMIKYVLNPFGGKLPYWVKGKFP